MNSYEDLIFYSKQLYQKGLAPGCSGNVSIKKNSHFAITASGFSLNDISSDTIVDLDFTGNTIGNGKASSEKMMHCLIYNNRSDINAIIHTHSPFLSTFALAGKGIKDSKIVELEYLFKNEVPIVSYNPPGSIELAKETANIIRNSDVAILENHGAIVCGKSLKEAFYKYEVLEYMAQVIIQEQLLRN